MAKRNRRRVPPKKKRGYEGGGLITAGFHLLGIMLSGIITVDITRKPAQTQDAEFEVIEPKQLSNGTNEGSKELQ